MKPGIYEQIINRQLASKLVSLPKDAISTSAIDPAEAAKVLSTYLEGILQSGLRDIRDNGGDLSDQVNFANNVVDLIRTQTGEKAFGDAIIDKGEQLLAITENPAGKRLADKKENVRPFSSIAESSLFTGAAHEPQIVSEIQKEILTADKIDILVAFIRWSGLRLIINQLREFCEKGHQLRVITTPYIGATDLKAIDALSELPNTAIRVNYDTQNTRLHAKAYIFYRESGFDTAYVGSSNISRSALTNGLEWNSKIARSDQPEVMQKIGGTFETYWHSPDFVAYKPEDREKLARALQAERNFSSENSAKYLVDVYPLPYQQEILDQLRAEREIWHRMRNLIVAATGTGKTIISALDYSRFRHKNPQSRLLFVAHREEILSQSRDKFRAVLKDENFGELCVGAHQPGDLDHLFISIQSVNSRNIFNSLAPNYYDYIVIDEFHHAAADSYQQLLAHFKPQILLGLTATPERMDGKDILKFFDGRIAAEIRLPEAINRRLLSPFQYFGVTDNIDLALLKWNKGGYDRKELSNVYTLSGEMAKRRADLVVRAILKYVTDLSDVKGLGFCVSIEHAKFMADYFNDRQIPAISLNSRSTDEERQNAKKLLETGQIRFIFVVDLYNEGVDIPAINTILFLRPTESLTVFLQQLGRGLRLAPGKECLTVLDFIGQAHKKYNFSNRFSGLLTNPQASLPQEIRKGFASVPLGCSIQLEKVAAQYILDNLRGYFNSTSAIIKNIANFTKEWEISLTLANFIDQYHLDIRQVYKNGYTFSRLCVKANERPDFNEIFEPLAVKAIQRMTQVNSRRWLTFLLDFLKTIETFDYAKINPLQQRMLQMFITTIWDKPLANVNEAELRQIFTPLVQSPVMRDELIEVLELCRNRINFIDTTLQLGFACPLDLHCNYSRDQILAALDHPNPASIREGVKWLPEKNIDVLFVTLNKSDKEYSPTTLYDDYSINDELFHWQSQSTTSEISPTGQRYINHRKNGSKILLFVRENKKDSMTGIASPYTFLGTGNYVEHSGSRPMNIIWKLDYRIPARFIKKTNKLFAC